MDLGSRIRNPDPQHWFKGTGSLVRTHYNQNKRYGTVTTNF
jgi:hypothetical protein